MGSLWRNPARLGVETLPLSPKYPDSRTLTSYRPTAEKPKLKWLWPPAATHRASSAEMPSVASSPLALGLLTPSLWLAIKTVGPVLSQAENLPVPAVPSGVKCSTLTRLIFSQRADPMTRCFDSVVTV